MRYREDLKLARALIRREPSAVAAFEARTQRLLLRCLARMRARYPRAIVEDGDLLQSFSVLLYQDQARVLAGYRGEAALTTWLYAIAARHFRAELEKIALRDAKHDPRGDEALAQLHDGAASPEAARASREELERVQRALAALPEEDRLLIQLVVIEEAPFASVAAALGISPAAARMRKMRALERLADALQKK